MSHRSRDHGGGIDAAIARWGGARDAWMDLSTGINPVPWPRPELPGSVWCALPDRAAGDALEQAARRFWAVPDKAAILAAPGASALIAQLPRVLPGRRVSIRPDTYNEHAASFRAAGWDVTASPAALNLVVNPNNPTGDFVTVPADADWVIDESFCDTAPERSLMARAGAGVTILKSFGKFWGLAGLRLGFAVGDPTVIEELRERLGPWPVGGPALAIGTSALQDSAWATATRRSLAQQAARLDALLAGHGLHGSGECPLFRLVRTPDAAAWHRALAARHVLTRTFPYAADWLRLGLPAPGQWDRLTDALRDAHGEVRGTVGGATAQPSAARRSAP